MPMQTSEPKEHATPRTSAEIQAWILHEVGGVLNVSPADVDATAPLATLGIASVDTFGITGALAEWLQKDVPATLMWDHPSIHAIADALADPLPQPPLSWPGVVTLQPLGNRRPIFFFPGQRGHPATFNSLAAALSPKQPCYGLTVPGLDGKNKPVENVEDIAAAMLQSLRLVQPHGPYQLAGYSFGGLLAYETARQLTAQGETISTLAIYDTFTPDGKRLRPAWQRVGLYFYLLATQYLRAAYLRERLARRRARLAENRPRAPRTEGETIDRTHFLRSIEVINIRAAEIYRPGPYDGSLTFFRATKRSRRTIFYKMDATGGWDVLTKRQVRIIDLQGTHLNILGNENVAAAAQHLAAILQN